MIDEVNGKRITLDIGWLIYRYCFLVHGKKSIMLNHTETEPTLFSQIQGNIFGKSYDFAYYSSIFIEMFMKIKQLAFLAIDLTR